MKQYNRYVMNPDGAWTRASVLCMAGSLFSLAVYYFGLRGLISVGFLEAVFCLFLPLILMAAFIALVHFMRWNAPGLFAIIGALLCVFLLLGIFGSAGVLRILLGILWYPLAGLILLACAGGYLPGKKPAVFVFHIAIIFRVIFNLGKIGLFGWVYELSAILTLAALACLMMSFEAKKFRQ
ncbi:MAG: hypothetical protein IJE24_06175 [Oscillospiraceae bacterium]|nr:hypothetical protein [Oscillospiraceae bacterium]